MKRTRGIKLNQIVDKAADLSRILGGCEKSPGQYMALCPAHNDHTPSLSIRQGNGTILLHCFAGCKYEDILRALEQKGISINQQTELKKSLGLPAGIFQEFNGKQYVAHWSYRNQSGEIIGYTVRYESVTGEKEFCPFFKKNGDQWETGYSSKDNRPLYNLDKVSQAGEEEEVWIVEGEKCADALTELGFVATTSPGGSNAAIKADWTPLAGRRVVIWPDNDQAGKVYAANVFRELEKVGESTLNVEQINVDELNLNEKEDICDWIKKGFESKDILSLPRTPIADFTDLGVIVVEPSRLYYAMDKAEELLLKKKPYEIFQRGGLMVRIFNPKHEKRKSKDESIKLINVRSGYLTDLLSRELTFVKSIKGELIPIEPPEKIAGRYLQRAGHWKLNSLEGLIFAPTLRPDGTVLECPGYDKESGIYYVDTKMKFFPLRKDSDKQLARAQLQRLRNLIQDFKFVNPEDESVMLAAILTALVRKNFITAPAFGFNAPIAGSGKTLLANIVHIIATGSPVTPMSIGSGKEEQEKQIFAKLIEGRPVILIDNVEEPIKSGMFCEIMTSSSGKHSGRILGLSETKDVPTTVTFLITGNNLSFQGDMTRRALMCTIDPQCEHPENRTGFKIQNLPEHVMKRRASYVWAGLTILKAYIVAGCPPQDIPTWGGFEEWSNLVRSALVWLDCADPYLTKRRIEQEDPEKVSLRLIVNLWKEIYGLDNCITVSEIVKDCNDSIEKKNTGFDKYELAQVFLEVTRSRGKQLNGESIGKWLRSNKDKIQDGYKIVKDPYSPSNRVRWILKKA